jgi:sulfide:quinone oxidoreductase
MSVSAQLARSGTFKPEEIHVFDPRDTHYYQPSFTMIGGGVLGNSRSTVKAKEKTYVKRPMKQIFNTGVNLIQEEVETFDPENNSFKTNKEEYIYDYLVVAPGCKLRYDLIEGASEALDDPDHPVVSIYREDYAYKTLKHRELLKNGTAIFYQPQMPIKCGGAPQKIMYLSESNWKKQGLRDKIDVQYYSALGVMFPPCEKFSVALNQIREKASIPVHFHHLMKKIDKDNMSVTFENEKTQEEVTVDYDFLHVVPPQKSPEFISSSPLAGKGGFCSANQETMQHPKYYNVFSCGDVADVPSSKTAATIFAQAPVVVHNITQLVESKETNAKYNGYGSCPLFVGDGKLMLAEFKYGQKPCETFSTKQEKPNRLFYLMKKEVFPRVYFTF